ncbi:unnamed protein product [Brassica oleracea var. botrytis]|uniref:(rape) hypothetical protein n=2 Tax=Brassica napus TaxID=3708 RepID=A0A816IZI1_BRANA|nr:unnamed protein product [Brassica napus]
MTQKNEEVPPGSHDLISSQQRKRKRRADNNESENTQPCGEASNNISTSVPLRKAFTRVLNDISNIPTNLRFSTVSIGTNPTNDSGNVKDQKALAKRLKSNSYKFMSQSSNQTTVSNIVGGSNNNKETVKRKRSTSIDVTEHTPSSYSSKKKCSKPGVLADITNTLPSMLGTPSTSGSCISKISTKGKDKVVAEDNKLKSNTRTKKCRKTLEQQFDGCVDDYSSCEDDEDQAFQCDYEEESELYKEQVYDCSSEESDTSDNETINCNPISKDSNANQRSPDVLSKEGNQEINTQRTSSCAKMVKRTSSSAQMMKPTSSRKSRGYIDDGDPTYKCEHCGAIMWYGERINNKKHTRKPKFALCCGQGQVQLPLLKDSPAILKQLLHGSDEQSRYFRDNIRAINMVFSFTSLGGKFDHSAPKGSGPKMIVLQGENYHLMGSLKPPAGDPAKFGQLYIVDTENEVTNRASIIGKYKKSAEKAKKESIRNQVIQSLMTMLNEVNPYVHQFRSAKDRFETNPQETFHMRIISSRAKDGRTYDTPTASEVAALIPGDFNLDMDKRDIVLQEKQTGWLKRISEIHPSYLALQYPLIFTYGEDGFRLGIKKKETEATAKLKRQTISMRQWYAFRLQERENECHTLLHSKRLFQQFLVDSYTSIESNRLCYLRMNQKSLRSDSYDSIQQSRNAGKEDMHDQGSRFLLPASFTGGPRYMKNNYLDAMAICKYFGFPDLFITFTCNPKWPEITRYLQQRCLTADDRPDIIGRIFKIKLDSLMIDLTDKELLGKTVSCELLCV